jgi:voltage-gated potassium channel
VTGRPVGRIVAGVSRLRRLASAPRAFRPDAVRAAMNLRPRIQRLPDGHVDLGWIEHLIQALIVLSLISFAVETLPDLSPGLRSFLEGFEVFAIGVFTVEYLVRVTMTRPRRRYAFSFFGLVDIIAILPFYLALGFDSESVRALRMLRLFRILKLARYNTAVLRFYRALVIAREELLLFGATALILLYLAGVGMYQFEHAAQPDKFRSVFDGLWWAVCTLTTVGYGDVYPITAGGKVFTFVMLVVGLGVISVPVGMVASSLSQARSEIEAEQKALAQAEAAAAAPVTAT